MCHTSDICVLCMVTSVTWSWPWTELNIKHLLNQCLALYFRSTRGKFWSKTDNFEVSTARNLKAPILTFDLTLTWDVTSFGKFRGCFRIVSSRAFKRRIVRLSAAIRSRVMTWGRFNAPPPPPASRGWRSTPANAGLTCHRLGYWRTLECLWAYHPLCYIFIIIIYHIQHKNHNFEVSTARNLKVPDFGLCPDLDLTRDLIWKI